MNERIVEVKIQCPTCGGRGTKSTCFEWQTSSERTSTCFDCRGAKFKTVKAVFVKDVRNGFVCPTCHSTAYEPYGERQCDWCRNW